MLDRSHRHRRPCARGAVLFGVLLGGSLWGGIPLAGQDGGTVLGQVKSAETGQPLAGATILLEGTQRAALSADDGRFIVIAVPPGTYRVKVTLIGYREYTLDGARVRAGRPLRLDVSLENQALEIEGVTAEVDRVRLVEPEVAATHSVFLNEEMAALPVDAVAEILELTPGVTQGHFRGGRVGQEVYVIDGLELKNQLEGSSEGVGLELPPSALDEVEVLTGGFGSEYGSALSGVVRYVTRRGDPDRWRGRIGYRSDHWVPEGSFRGFGELSASAGGPLDFIDDLLTMRVDVLAQGMRDAEPRARGLTCLQPGDGDQGLDQFIRTLQADEQARALYCPYSGSSLPYQQGEKLIGFVRLDRPLSPGALLTVTALRNRLQRELYTPEFKYNPDYQLGQRSDGTLVTVALDLSRQGLGGGMQLRARGAAFRLDRYLGALDRGALLQRSSIGGVGVSGYPFLGEDFVRSPIQDQVSAGSAVPGYIRPGGFSGSPFGAAGEGLFSTEGTPDVANWNRAEFLGGDVQARLQSAAGHEARLGISGKAYRMESYERTLAYLAGSQPAFSRFFPATITTYAEGQLAAADEVRIQIGGRIEAFRSGVAFREDRGNVLAPVIEPGWRVSFLPRIAVSAPVPGTGRSTAFRFSYSQVAQPPDFQFFLDTTLGDSVRTRVRRQGNPDLTFERGSAFEVGVSQEITRSLGLDVVGFRKELTNLVTGSLGFDGFAEGQFTTGDFGSVAGIEGSLRVRWDGLRIRAGYALQEAKGVANSAFDSIGVGEGQVGQARVETPLAFDRRHAATIAVFGGNAAGGSGPWGGTFVTSLSSGVPIERDTLDLLEDIPKRLPWTFQVDLRGSYDLGAAPGCSSCRWRITFDARNLLGRANVLGVRRSTGGVGPTLAEVEALAQGTGLPGAIPRESARYSILADLDGNGLVSTDELGTARMAAALDRLDPSLFFGDARQLRLGVEVSFR